MRVDVGHGTSGGYLQIAANQQGAYGRSGEQRRSRPGRQTVSGGLAAPKAGNRHETHKGNVVLKKLDCFRAKAREDERGFDGMDVRSIGRSGYGSLRRRRGDQLVGRLWGPNRGGVPGICAHDSRLRIRVYRQHLGNGGDAGDGFLAELTYSVRQCAQQLAVDVNGAAAHPGNHAGVLWFGALETGQDHILIGAENILEHPEDLHVHGFGFGAFKDCIGHAMEATMDLRQRKDAGGGGGGWRSRSNLGSQAARGDKNCGQNRKAS